MLAAGIRTYDGDIELLELPDPRPPGADEVLMRMRAAGAGVWEDEIRTGGWDIGHPPPLALGVEAAGVLEAVGAAVTGLSPGDWVMSYLVPLRDQGAWSESLLAPAALTVAKPPNVGWASAGALPAPGITAVQVVESVLRLGPGERVLICGAGGVTGGCLVQLAALAGAVVTATASAASAPRVLGYGAHDVVDYHDADWPDHVRAATGGDRVEVAIVAAPGASAAALPTVRDGGRLLTIVADPPAAERGIDVYDFVLEPERASLSRAAELAAEGFLRVPVALELPLYQAASGLKRAVAGQHGGAVALTMGP